MYEVVGVLGAGGMGEVYRAHDTKLNRDVALKVLPDAFATDPWRVARFTHEAQTLAALNHSNIAHIHGLEETENVRALAMELVEGEDLSDRLFRGAISSDEALPMAKQIAEALEAGPGYVIYAQAGNLMAASFDTGAEPDGRADGGGARRAPAQRVRHWAQNKRLDA